MLPLTKTRGVKKSKIIRKNINTPDKLAERGLKWAIRPRIL